LCDTERPETLETIRAVLHRYGQPESLSDELLEVVQATARAGLSLNRDELGTIGSATHGIAELEMLLPFEPGARWKTRLEDAMREEGGLFARYASSVRLLSVRQLGGFVRGFVDWVGVIADRSVVVDYKSNLLSSYEPADLERAMLEHHYPMQALVYVVALARHLKRCGTQVARGGAHYLFLRGLSGNESKSGVVSLHPSDALLACLEEELLGGTSL
ncbi:MAG: PD-(D/E)XK nuclease family protein, partial [Myxococcota bacterium]